MSNPRVHLGPTGDSFLAREIERGGGALVPLADADAVVWTQTPIEVSNLAAILQAKGLTVDR